MTQQADRAAVLPGTTDVGTEHWSYRLETPFLPMHQLLEQAEAPAVAGTRRRAWQRTTAQGAFREAVLAEALAQKARARRPQPDLPAARLRPVAGTRVAMRTDAADAAGRLLAAANADLAVARRAGDADAKSTRSLGATSGYRARAHQERVWRSHFEDYYDQTAAARDKLAGGPHGVAAVAYMLDTFRLPRKVAAPGYSNHQNGIAIDLSQVRERGHRVRNSTRPAEVAKWHASWFHGWLVRRAREFGFTPYMREPWHWEYTLRPTAATGPMTQGELDGVVQALLSENERGWEQAASTEGLAGEAEDDAGLREDEGAAGWGEAEDDDGVREDEGAAGWGEAEDDDGVREDEGAAGWGEAEDDAEAAWEADEEAWDEDEAGASDGEQWEGAAGGASSDEAWSAEASSDEPPRSGEAAWSEAEDAEGEDPEVEVEATDVWGSQTGEVGIERTDLGRIAERVALRETLTGDEVGRRPVRWTARFTAADIAAVRQEYADNLTAATANSVDRASCIVMLNVALGQLLALRRRSWPARTKSTRRVQMADLTTETIEQALATLVRRGYARGPVTIDFLDDRGLRAGTRKPIRLRSSVRAAVLARTAPGHHYAFAMSIMDGFHSVLLLVDRTGADPVIQWFDQKSPRAEDLVTTTLNDRLTTSTKIYWQDVMDEKRVGYKTPVRLWQLRKRVR